MSQFSHFSHSYQNLGKFLTQTPQNLAIYKWEKWDHTKHFENLTYKSLNFLNILIWTPPIRDPLAPVTERSADLCRYFYGWSCWRVTPLFPYRHYRHSINTEISTSLIIAIEDRIIYAAGFTLVILPMAHNFEPNFQAVRFLCKAKILNSTI